jgi:hypothetical protein
VHKHLKTPTSVKLALARVRSRAQAAAAAHEISPFSIPQLLKEPDEIRSLRLDRRAGSVLAKVDGETGVQALADLSGLPREEVLAILGRLAAIGVVTMR